MELGSIAIVRPNVDSKKAKQTSISNTSTKKERKVLICAKNKRLTVRQVEKEENQQICRTN